MKNKLIGYSATELWRYFISGRTGIWKQQQSTKNKYHIDYER